MKLKLLFKQKDKIKHLIAGGLISIINSIILYYFNLDLVIIGISSLVISTLVGIAKEVYDKKSNKGVCDRMDAIATSIGGAIGALIFQVLIIIF